MGVEWPFLKAVPVGEEITAGVAVVTVHDDKPICTLATTVRKLPRAKSSSTPIASIRARCPVSARLRRDRFLLRSGRRSRDRRPTHHGIGEDPNPQTLPLEPDPRHPGALSDEPRRRWRAFTQHRTAGGLEPRPRTPIKASRRLRAIPWPACRLKVEAELEARRFCRPAEGGNCCRPRRATRARAGSHPCEKQAVAITQDAGDPPRGRAIRIPAGEIIARRTVTAGWGHGWGMVLVFSHYLIEKEAFHAIVGAVTASATTACSPARCGRTTSSAPDNCSPRQRMRPSLRARPTVGLKTSRLRGAAPAAAAG